MPSLIFQIISWPVLGTALAVFGFAPGAVLRLIVLAFPRDDPRHRELLGELYAVPRIERPFWVAEKLDVALFEGLRGRLAHRRAHELVGVQESLGYRGPVACAAAGITYRQLDCWVQTGLVEPSALAAHGPGSERLYSFRDILMLRVIKRLLGTGVSLPPIRAAVSHLRDRTIGELARLTLMGDGRRFYECTTPDEVVDLLAGGQGVFGIALGRIWDEVDCTLMELPGEPAAASGGAAGGTR